MTPLQHATQPFSEYEVFWFQLRNALHTSAQNINAIARRQERISQIGARAPEYFQAIGDVARGYR